MISKDFIQNNFPKGKLTLVCSRPSIGKTALAVSLAISMAEGNKKVVFSLWKCLRNSSVKD